MTTPMSYQPVEQRLRSGARYDAAIEALAARDALRVAVQAGVVNDQHRQRLTNAEQVWDDLNTATTEGPVPA